MNYYIIKVNSQVEFQVSFLIAKCFFGVSKIHTLCAYLRFIFSSNSFSWNFLLRHEVFWTLIKSSLNFFLPIFQRMVWSLWKKRSVEKLTLRRPTKFYWNHKVTDFGNFHNLWDKKRKKKPEEQKYIFFSQWEGSKAWFFEQNCQAPKMYYNKKSE